MPDVVTVQEARVRAAREATARIAAAQGPADRRRDAAGSATDVQRAALVVLDDSHEARIAGQAAGGPGRQRRAVLDLAAARCVRLAQRLGIDMHDDLLALAAGQRPVAMGQPGLGEARQRVGAALAPGGFDNGCGRRGVRERDAVGAV